MSWDALYDRAAAYDVDREAIRAALARQRSAEEPPAATGEDEP